MGGELTSLRAQLQRLESDLGDYKNINKQYTDQLVKVKVSSSTRSFTKQSNSTRCPTWPTMISKNMERHWTSRAYFLVPCGLLIINAATYSAIMKYHSLKMEEVNDTMRHLWNRTYQGTGTQSSSRSLHNLSRQFPKTSMEFGSVMIAKAASLSDRITIGCVFFITAVGLVVDISPTLMTLAFRS
jgi:hypothetical protein